MSPVYNYLSENLRQHTPRHLASICSLHTESRHVELLKPTTLFKNYIKNEASRDIQRIVTFFLNNTN